MPQFEPKLSFVTSAHETVFTDFACLHCLCWEGHFSYRGYDEWLKENEGTPVGKYLLAFLKAFSWSLNASGALAFFVGQEI